MTPTPPLIAHSRTSRRIGWVRLALVTAALLGVSPAAAAPGVTVQGVLIPPAKVEAPSAQRLGFLEPIENPIVELRQYDPFPECFVYLEGGPTATDVAAPPKATVNWQLESHSLSPPLLPVMVGTVVEITNRGRETQLLYSPTQEDLLPKEPIGPNSAKTLTVTSAQTPLLILSKTSPHLEGRVVGLPNRYFSRVDRNGKFKIENVPPGRWTFKLWYRDGWSNLAGRTIEVPGKDLKIDLPSDALALPSRSPEPVREK